MKAAASVKKMCRNCKIIRRKGVVRVICTDRRRQAASRSDKGFTMARIAGINIPPHKHAEIGLTPSMASAAHGAEDLRAVGPYSEDQGPDRWRSGEDPRGGRSAHDRGATSVARCR